MNHDTTKRILLGDEAVALAAADAGIGAAYGYPGTPSTEILEALKALGAGHGRALARWCANEKTAYETALGASLVGRRSIVTMKHVGLNVAADPFMSSALVAIHGGLVLAVADDPGMHSSQNEQDSRLYADFARTFCFEPADQQEAYDMTREAFELSERFEIPVLLRLVTRLSHSRALVVPAAPSPEKPLRTHFRPETWTLLPVNARKRWRHLLGIQPELLSYSEQSRFCKLDLSEDDRGLGVLTTGIARNYYLENLPDLGFSPSHLHIGTYPAPVGLVRRLAEKVQTLLVLEEGYPHVEGRLRGILPLPITVKGKLSGEVPLDGELSPDNVRAALGLPARPTRRVTDLALPPRPPQLCAGCPHRDTFEALHRALRGHTGALIEPSSLLATSRAAPLSDTGGAPAEPLVTSDIGCYTLGALEPISMGQTCVCMGASIGMARGAAEAGIRPVVAVIGDGTFVHSGMTALCDAIAADTDMTVIILDNSTAAMTGAQETVVPSAQLGALVVGLGAHAEHVHTMDAHPRKVDAMAEVIGHEIAHPGLSVVIARRECLEVVRRRKKEAAS